MIALPRAFSRLRHETMEAAALAEAGNPDLLGQSWTGNVDAPRDGATMMLVANSAERWRCAACRGQCSQGRIAGSVFPPPFAPQHADHRISRHRFWRGCSPSSAGDGIYIAPAHRQYSQLSLVILACLPSPPRRPGSSPVARAPGGIRAATISRHLRPARPEGRPVTGRVRRARRRPRFSDVQPLFLA